MLKLALILNLANAHCKAPSSKLWGSKSKLQGVAACTTVEWLVEHSSERKFCSPHSVTDIISSESEYRWMVNATVEFCGGGSRSVASFPVPYVALLLFSKKASQDHSKQFS